jgi:hypothetical protein
MTPEILLYTSGRRDSLPAACPVLVPKKAGLTGIAVKVDCPPVILTLSAEAKPRPPAHLTPTIVDSIRLCHGLSLLSTLILI